MFQIGHFFLQKSLTMNKEDKIESLKSDILMIESLIKGTHSGSVIDTLVNLIHFFECQIEDLENEEIIDE
jgi:hypothetical protein